MSNRDGDYIDKLTSKRVSWLVDNGPEDDIAISTRIRLARNLKDIPFPVRATEEELRKVVLAVELAVEKSNYIKKIFTIDMNTISEIDSEVLLERRLISREFCNKKRISSLIMSDREDIAIMVNEEDHLRAQAIRSGFQLKEVWDELNGFETSLSKQLPFEFDPKLGFLTSCPTNLGTGIRASVMLHLPGLVLAGQITPLMQGIYKLGLAVRGILGEGTDNLGNFFQISNQSTLGESEPEIIKRLSTVIAQIINHEKNARGKLLETNKDMLLDNIGRAYGILKYSYVITTKETLNSLSMLRLGVDMGVIRSINIHTVNELFVTIQPAHLQKYAGKEVDSEERDKIRATLIRESLNKGKS